jgi:hypothetical protein
VLFFFEMAYKNSMAVCEQNPNNADVRCISSSPLPLRFPVARLKSCAMGFGCARAEPKAMGRRAVELLQVWTGPDSFKLLEGIASLD